MAEILDDYSNNSGMGKDRATNGGQQTPKKLSYSPPVGPTAQMQKGPGIHGTNHGYCGTQGKY